MDKRILITGGTGFVGHWLTENHPIDQTGNGWLVNIGSGDYNTLEWMKHQWDCIIHAAPISPDRVLNYSKIHGGSCRVLYVSSGIVYHPENDTEYRQNKIKWEQECLESGVDVVIARLFTFYGEKLDNKKAYTQFKNAAEKGEPLRIWGNGKTIRSYMHGSEMARWMWAILLHGESGQAYDVGDDTPVTMYELAAKMAFLGTRTSGGPKFASRVIIENRIPDPVPVYLPVDTAKTKKLLEKM